MGTWSGTYKYFETLWSTAQIEKILQALVDGKMDSLLSFLYELSPSYE